jgi:YVTN family beta-propeller protein
VGGEAVKWLLIRLLRRQAKRGQVAMTPDGKRVYVYNVRNHTVDVIDTDTNVIVCTIPMSGSRA